MANRDDYFQKVGRSTATTLAAPGYTTGVSTSINIGATTNWPTTTGVTFAIDEVDSAGARVAGTYNVYRGKVAGAGQIDTMLWVNGDGDRNYSAGATTRVYILVSADHDNRMVDGLVVEHTNLTGYHTLTSNATMTSPKVITSLNDTNGNELLKVTATGSAVNELTLANAAAGGTPTLSATGSDTDIGIDINSKGAGLVKINGLPPKTYAAESTFDFVASGCVWSADSAGTTLAGSMTAGVVYIGGVRVVVALVTAHAFTASKDTYIDVGANGTVDYTEVANNAASPALAASHIRLGIVVTDGTDIHTAASINQGQEDRVLPIASSIPYAVTDLLGNLICPRDPNRKLLGYRQQIANATNANNTDTLIPALSCPVVVPAGRKVKVTAYQPQVTNSGANINILTIYSGVVGTTLLQQTNTQQAIGAFTSMIAEVVTTPATAYITYTAGIRGAVGTTTFTMNPAYPGFIKVELE